MATAKLWSPPTSQSRTRHNNTSGSGQEKDKKCDCKECQHKNKLILNNPPDTRIAGDKIGHGTFGSIYVYQPDPTKVVKFIIHEFHNETTLIEMAITRCIRHNSFISSEQIINENGKSVYIILPRAISDLRIYVKRRREENKQVLEKDLLAWLVQLLDGLNYIHQRFLIHADIKPNNIVLFPRDANVQSYEPEDLIVKFIDFGKSRYKNSRYNTKAVTGCVASPEYLADHITWSFSTNPQSIDIWSLACTFVDLFTGERLYQTENIDTLDKVHEAISRIQQDTPLGKILHKMLTINPNERPTAAQLLADPLLAPYLEGNLDLNPSIYSSPSLPISKGEKENIFKIKNNAGYDVPPHDWILTIIGRMRWGAQELKYEWTWNKLSYFATNLVMEMQYDIKQVQNNFRVMSRSERNQIFSVLEKINYSLLRD